MNLRIEFDNATAAKVAEFFEREGMTPAAIKMWHGLCVSNPYDRGARERLAELFFNKALGGFPHGTLAKSRLILDVINQSFPSQKLSEVYFDNLRQLMQTRTRRAEPGSIVLGIGAGRCGGTTLADTLAQIPDACATHENSPHIFWQPLEEQVRFHFERFRVLVNYYALLFDFSHWWLNVLDRFFAEFPAGKAIGLERETGASVKSFLHVKGAGAGTANHWAPPDNKIWESNLWDPSYPTYPLALDAAANPDATKAEHIRRYVVEYNQTLRAAAEKFPARVLLLRTEDLNSPTTAARLGDFLGFSVTTPSKALNVGTTADSDRSDHKL